jgi:hypothetical protein
LAVAVDARIGGGALLIADGLTPLRVTAVVLLSRNFQVRLAIAMVLGVVAVPVSALGMLCVACLPLLPLFRSVEANIITDERV